MQFFFRRIRVYFLVFSVVFLFVIGLFLIYSATYREIGFYKVIKQSIFFLLAILASFFVFKLEMKSFYLLSNYLYYFILFILIYVLIRGHTALGATRWIKLGFITFQPSEFAKLVLIIFLAVNLSIISNNFFSWQFVKILFKVFFMTLLIMKQPDLGTSLVFIFILYIQLFVLGFNPYILILSIISFALVIFPFLKDYQLKRLTIFLNPYSDPVGAGWNIIQSLIAVGAGQLYGVGFLKGFQTQLKFVPEHSTDFIFTVLAEEFGFIGVLVVIILYSILLYLILYTAIKEKELFYKLLLIGIFSMLFFHIFVNIGMDIGIMPVTGVPLPFLSYGGTSIFVDTIAVSLVLKVISQKGEDYE